MKKPLVSIIIVNWNGGDIFAQCLDSLSKIHYPNYELIIVDNGSTDGSEQMPWGTKRLVVKKFIKNKKNLGFAGANNQGFKVSRGEYILLLNNDTRVTRNFLDIMVTRMEKDSSIGVMQPKLFILDNPGYLDNAGSFLTWTGFLQHRGYEEKDSREFDSEREIHTAKGACMLIRRKVIDQVGLFDPDFVSYFEESDFCGRAWLAGWRILYYPRAHIFHKVGFSSKRLVPVDVNYHSLKNRIASLYKNLETKNLFLILVPHLFLLGCLASVYLVRLQVSKFMMVGRAVFWNIANFGKLTKKRQRVQKLREVGDDQLFAKLMVSLNFSEILRHFAATEKNF